MKKYLMIGASALLAGVMVTSCSNDEVSLTEYYEKVYEQAFVKVFGEIDANQDWGFSSQETRATRSMEAPQVADIAAPYDEAWVATYNATAKEPNSTNVDDNFDNSTYATNTGEGGPNSIDWNDPDQVKDRNYFFGDDGNQDSWETRLAWALANHPTWVTYTADETFVRNFKITGTYSGTISVAATEGLTDGVANGNERTIVVTGTWNITESQRIGSLGKIIIANGGTVNVASGVALEMVNQARLVVLAGGTLTGEGSVSVNNGNAVGEENYNAGTVDVATFNNNFGKFYNYGSFLVNEYQGGAQESNFYNHSLVNIHHFGGSGSTANARIFNACQFYVQNDARIRNYEGVNGSALIVGGQLLMSSSEDGTSTPTYVGLAAGALVKCGTLYNNGTSWRGPVSGGYAALEIVSQIDYLNWQQDSPQTAGYFANNIYVKCGTWENDPAGQGKHEDVDDGSEWGHINYTESRAEYKFWSVAANCTGNGNVTKVNEGTTELLPADNDFVLGQQGCTPGFTGDEGEEIIPGGPTTKSIRIMAEDLSASEASDFDFNDVVFDVEAVYSEGVTSVSQVKVTVWAAGGTLPLKINSVNGQGGFEVHDALGISEVKTMINTHAEKYAGTFDGITYYWADNIPKYEVESLTLANNATIGLNTFLEDINEYLRVEVEKQTGTWNLLTAKRGQPACKIAVPVGTPWALEKHNMNNAFTQFKSWVNNGTPADWYNSKQNAQIYNGGNSVIYGKFN